MALDQNLFYKTLVQDAPDAVIYADARGKIAFWNRAAERIFGFTSQEAVGRSLDIIIPERSRKRHWEGYDATLRTGKTRYGAGDLLAVPALRKDGTRISVGFTILPFRTEHGKIAGVAAVLRDVTKHFLEIKTLRKALEEQGRGAPSAAPGASSHT